MFRNSNLEFQADCSQHFIQYESKINENELLIKKDLVALKRIFTVITISIYLLSLCPRK